jgi:hypothetical protein
MSTDNCLKPLKHLLLTATLCSVFVLPSHAQDPPTRVADLNYVMGNVSMQPAGADDWSPAVVNRPFTTGDNLWADTDGQAELHLNNATMRLGPQSSLGFLNLADNLTQIRFTQGELVLRVRRLGEDESFEVDTPNVAVTILREGEYRFTADPDAATTYVVVRHGQAEITGGGQAFTLAANNSAQLSGTDQLAYDVQVAPQYDGLEAWCRDRDAREARVASARYLPPDVIGYEELDAYGNWRDTPDYGAVWYPTVDAGWAPYSNGYWAWIEPWGWSWVDQAPWGFAPSHYGRWAYVGGGWGWIPGPVAIVSGGTPMAAVYAPALVAFIGGGGWGASLSIGGPAVGWVALGPGEVYAPAYQVSQNYFRTVNVSSTKIVNTVNITNVYNNVYVNKTVNVTVNQRFANMAAPNAVMAMPQGAFASGRPVKQVAVAVPKNQVGQIQTSTMTVAPSVAPAKQALAPAAAASGRPAPRPPARATSVQVVAKVAPPAAPVPFAAKQAALQQNAGKPLNTPAIRQSLPPARVAAAPPVKVAPPAKQVVPTVRPAGAPAPVAPASRPPVAMPVAPQSNPRPAQPNAPANRPPAATPPAPRPAQPSAPPAPANRPPAATPPAPQSNPRPVQPNAAPPPANRPPAEENNPRPAEPKPAPGPAYRPPAAPQSTPRPAQPPPQQKPAKATQKPKKDEEKEKPKE